VSDLNAIEDPGSAKRRSTRVVQAVPIVVSGADALGQSFKERTSTVMVNCHGCKYQSKHYVPKSSWVTLEIPRQEASLPTMIVRGRVVWVQRPRTVRELFQIGVEFETSGNYWGIAFPPDDWNGGSTTGPGEIPAPGAHAPIGATESTEHSNKHAADKKLEIVPPPASSLQSHVHFPEHVETPVPTSAIVHETLHGATSILGPTPADLAKEMERLVAEAKHSLHQVARYESRTAVSEEIESTRSKIDAQLREAVDHALQTSVSRVSEQALQVVVRQSALQTASIVENARAAAQRDRIEIEAQLHQSLEAAIREHATQAAGEAVRLAAESATSETLHQAVDDAVSKAIANRAAVPDYFATDDAARGRSEQLQREIEEAGARARAQSVEQIQNEASAAANHAQNDIREALEAAARVRAQHLELIQNESGAAAGRWQNEIQASLDAASRNLNEQLARVSQEIVAQAERDIAARSSNLRVSFEAATSDAQRTIEALQAATAEEQSRVESAKGEIQDVAQRSLEALKAATSEEQSRAEAVKNEIQDTAQRSIEALRSAASEEQSHAEAVKGEIRYATRAALDTARQKFDEMQSSHLADVGRLAENVVAEKVQRLEPALEASAQQIFNHVAAEITNQLTPQIDSARQVAGDLATARQQAEEARDSLKARIQDAAEDSLRNALERLKQQTEQFPAQLEEDLRARLKKAEEELESKTTEAMHSTFESLLKASDWYSKKAQGSMQASLEKAVDHSTTELHERAAETSRKFTSELDHYSRNYVQHAQNQMEEAAGDAAERAADKIKENADTTAATFADEVHRLASNTLSQFEDASRESTDRMEMQLAQSQDRSLIEFRGKLDERVEQGLVQASSTLETQLKPLIEDWQKQREGQQRAWMEHLQQATDQSIDHFKSRLENASNSWLLASATTLGQHSQAVIETLAQLAEKRLRDACSDVLAGMGDTIRQRLMNISSGFGAPAKSSDKPEDKDPENQ
jgi:hypothetical protein